MPLKKGFGKQTFQDNVAKSIREGKKPNQAVAIAYEQRRTAKRDVASAVGFIQKMRTKKK